ncbi:MAG: SusD/RagB family nutrient-binding outer membrane lipoprotein [Gemmatimonadales bacterium]
MRNASKTALALALAATAGCSDFLSGPGIDTNPNAPNVLTRPGPLYIGAQGAQVVQFEGQLARNAAMYAQQVAGSSRQQVGFDRGQSAPSDIDTYFNAVYGSTRTVTGGGGLLDIKKMQQLARSLGDSTYLGIGKVYEGLVMGYAASIWGDIPYREAADSTNLTPAYDPQLQVYADVLAQLDSGINVFLPAAGPSNLGPNQDGAELVYAGRATAGLRAVYTEVAHSLKARYYMHLAETDASNYALALAEVGPPGVDNGGPGISSPANDFLWFHDNSPNGANIWHQFSFNRGDISPGAALVEILKRRIADGVEDDARLLFYFVPADPDADGTPDDFFGFRPGAAAGLQTTGGIYDGSGSPEGNFSFFGPIIDGNPGGSTDFRTPLITWAETQLIGAEAALATGNAGLAQQYLDAVRANRTFGIFEGSPVSFPALGSVPATLQSIIEEKYVTLFLNPEVWNDYKRTCLPALAPAPQANSSVPGTSPIPGRMPYGQTEINANSNSPSVSSAGGPITSTSQNPNDPTACPVLNYTSSTPLAN